MRSKTAFRYFDKVESRGKRKLAGLLGVTTQSLYSWKDIVPYVRQLQIEKLTGGKLKAMTPEQYAKAKYPA